MAGINKVILVGRLGKDPEVRYTPDGKAITNITLATSENWKDKSTGERKEKTEWHRVVFFGALANIVGEFLKKGSQVYLEGKLQTRKWQNQQGQDQYTTEIVVDGIHGVMQMLDGKPSGETEHTDRSADYNQQPHNQPFTQDQADFIAGGDPDDDIPFVQHERFLL